MALSESDWASIYAAIAKAQNESEIVYGTVIKRDEARKLIWMEEFGDQPIPLVGFNGKVKIYDELPLGLAGAYGGKTTKIKKVDLVHEVPQVGQTAVVL